MNDLQGMEDLELVPMDEPQPLSRRRFLTGAAAGGAAGLAMAAGTGVAVWKVMDTQALAAQEAARQAAEAEIARFQGLLDLYERLEKIGLDAILETGIAAVALPLLAAEKGAEALKNGLDWSEGALRSLDEALPTADEALLWLEEQVTAIADGIEKLETALGKALNKAADNLVAEALQAFAAMILNVLPFGLGDRIRDVLDGLIHVMTSVDSLVKGINVSVLQPLREKWFSGQEGQGLGASLSDPLIERILDPLEAHLANLALLADQWQDKLMAPAQKALTQRAEVREEIARYKSEHGFG
jgi:hypothetical protein